MTANRSMPDELTPLNMRGHANTWEEELLETLAERDQLRAANERLQAELVKATEQGEHWYRLWTERGVEIQQLRSALLTYVRRFENICAAGEHDDTCVPCADLRQAKEALGMAGE